MTRPDLGKLAAIPVPSNAEEAAIQNRVVMEHESADGLQEYEDCR